MRGYIWALVLKLGLGFLAILAALGALSALIVGMWGTALALGVIALVALWVLNRMGVSVQRGDS